jgi:hypothetical protein
MPFEEYLPELRMPAAGKLGEPLRAYFTRVRGTLGVWGQRRAGLGSKDHRSDRELRQELNVRHVADPFEKTVDAAREGETAPDDGGGAAVGLHPISPCIGAGLAG